MCKVIKRKIIKSDVVCVISGKDKGKVGKVLKVLSIDGFRLKVVVSGVNLGRVLQKDASGSRWVSKEFPVDISNVMYFDPSDNVKSRLGFKFIDGKKVRYCKSSQKVLS